jgi:hypothetical protein
VSLHIESMNQPATALNSGARKPVKTELKFACRRPIDPVCERIVTAIDGGWSYRSVAAEWTLTVGALWEVVAWGVRKLREENRELRKQIRSLEQTLGTGTGHIREAR